MAFFTSLNKSMFLGNARNYLQFFRIDQEVIVLILPSVVAAEYLPCI